MDYVTRLAAGMHLVEPRHVLCADHVMEEWDPELVGCRGGGRQLQSPDRTQVHHQGTIASSLLSQGFISRPWPILSFPLPPVAHNSIWHSLLAPLYPQAQRAPHPLPNRLLCLNLKNVPSALLARTRSSASCRTCDLTGRAAATG